MLSPSGYSPPPSSSQMSSPPYTPYPYSPEKTSPYQGYNNQSPSYNHYQLLQQPPLTPYVDNQSENNYAGSPTKSIHITLASCNQSSVDSQHELSPPYSASNYSFPSPTNSPSNSLGYCSGSDSTSCPYSSPQTQHSPYADATLPYLDTLPGVPGLTMDAQAIFMPDLTGFSDCPFPTAGETNFTEVFSNGSHQKQATQGIQYQESTMIFAPTMSQQQPTMGGYAAQAKARYNHIAVAGGHSNETRRLRNEGTEIKDISRWLQESAPVH